MQDGTHNIVDNVRTQMIESENICLLLVDKALFIHGFWGVSEEVPVTRDMTVHKRCNC
jgi:hypothetical protein